MSSCPDTDIDPYSFTTLFTFFEEVKERNSLNLSLICCLNLDTNEHN